MVKVLAMCCAAFVFYLILYIFRFLKNKVREYNKNSNPDNPDYLIDDVIKYYFQGNYSEAKIKIDKIINQEYDNILAKSYLAMIYYNEKEHTKLKPLVKELMEDLDGKKKLFNCMLKEDITQPILVSLYYSYGYVLLQEGNKEQSQKWKKKATEMNSPIQDLDWLY